MLITTKSDTYRAMVIREMWLIDNETHEVEVRSFEVGKEIVYETGQKVRSEVLNQIEIPISPFFQ